MIESSKIYAYHVSVGFVSGMLCINTEICLIHGRRPNELANGKILDLQAACLYLKVDAIK